MHDRHFFRLFPVSHAILGLALCLGTLLIGTATLASPAIAAESFKEAVVVAIHDGDTVSLKME